ncbi:MAG TPA: MscL family protein [Candidatus Thermoplasmatota archaeon]|nr:MscL family protein [Candidatus Thermoplasmatota archaeon]
MSTVTAETPAAEPRLNLFQEFRAFLDKYGVVGLAIAFIIGAALTALVQALVQDILMPTLAPLFATLGEDWQSAEAWLGPFGPYKVGHFAYATIYFLIIALFVFLVAKYVLREKQVAKR